MPETLSVHIYKYIYWTESPFGIFWTLFILRVDRLVERSVVTDDGQMMDNKSQIIFPIALNITLLSV